MHNAQYIAQAHTYVVNEARVMDTVVVGEVGVEEIKPLKALDQIDVPEVQIFDGVEGGQAGGARLDDSQQLLSRRARRLPGRVVPTTNRRTETCNECVCITQQLASHVYHHYTSQRMNLSGRSVVNIFANLYVML